MTPNPTIPEQQPDLLCGSESTYVKWSVPLNAAKVCVQVVKVLSLFWLGLSPCDHTQLLCHSLVGHNISSFHSSPGSSSAHDENAFIQP